LPQINLSDNKLGSEGAKALAPAIRDSHSLTSISLRFNNLGPEGAKALGPAIAVSHSLTAVDTRNNGIIGEGAEQLAAAVLGSSSMITFGDIPMKQLRADELTTLNMAGRDIDGRDLGLTEARVLAGLIPVSGSLTQINLCGIYLKEGAEALAPAIRDSHSLNSVILEKRHGSGGCPLPVKQLKGTDPVASINLSGKGLGMLSAIVIAELIKSNVSGSLNTISLSNNDLSNHNGTDMSGAKAIADAIGVSHSLTAADLERCNLGDQAKQMLRDCVKDRAGFDLKL